MKKSKHLQKILNYVFCVLFLISCGPQEPPKIAVTGIALDRVAVTLTEGETTTLVATVTPADATDKSVIWSSSNIATATVSESGVVSAVHAGTTVITAKTNDGGITASCSITVDIAMAAITGDATNISCRNAVLSGKANLPGTTATDLTFGILYSTNSGVLIGKATQIEADVFDSDFNYSITTGILEPETTYYYRSYISQNNEITYGDTKSFKTLAVSSMIKTEDATEIDAGVATLNATLDLTDCKYDSIEYGFIITPKDGTEGSYKATDLSNKAYSYKVETLVRDKQYDVVAYVTLDGRTYTAESKSFTTQSIKASIALNEVSNITEIKATLSGKLNIESQGQFSKSAKLYYRDTNGTAEELKANGTVNDLTLNSDGTFSLVLQGLESDKTYYYAVIVTVDGVDFASEVKSFTTTTVGVNLTTSDATGITEFTGTLNGTLTVTSIENVSKEVWFYYSATATTAETLKLQGTKATASLGSNGSFSKQLTGLTENTTYYYIACAKVNGKDYVSDVKSFKTTTIGVTANDATGITEFKGTINGTLMVISIESVSKEVWFYYSATATTAETLKLQGTKATASLGSNRSFSKQLTGLTENTTYYYIACAKVNGKDYISEVKSFKTAEIDVRLIVNDATNITELKATISGELLVNSIESVSKSVCFYCSKTEMTADNLKQNGVCCEYGEDMLSPNGSFSYVVDDFTFGDFIDDDNGFAMHRPIYNTEIFYIACAYVNGKEYISEVKSFKSPDFAAALTLCEVSPITEFIAKLCCDLEITSIANLSEAAIVSFYYSKTAVTATELISSGTMQYAEDYDGETHHWVNLYDLTSNTTYYYVVKARLFDKEYISDVGSFKTADYQADVETGEAKSIGWDTATLKGELSITSIENLDTEAWFLYSETASSLDELIITGIKTEATLTDGVMTAKITGLKDGAVSYRYVACAKVHEKVFYGAVRLFETKAYIVPEAVDMGLSVKWGSLNIGASESSDAGLFYAWGEISPKSSYTWSNYSHCKGTKKTLTKYCSVSTWGSVDKKTRLEKIDDVAAQKLGNSWRIPTDEEWTDLFDPTYCSLIWTEEVGVYGCMVTSKITGNSIFLPASGYRKDKSRYEKGTRGLYWSSDCDSGDSYIGVGAYVENGSYWDVCVERNWGLSVRPVCD